MITSKRHVHDLALLGGPPCSAIPLHVGAPNIGDRARLLSRIEDALDRRLLSNDGPYVREVEDRIAVLTGARHCVAVSNGTVGLELAARATNLSGDVIMPAFTFVATAHALRWHGIRPVFCDVDPETHTIAPDEVAALVTPETTGIVGVHLWGQPCAIDALEAVAATRRLTLLFDAAHALGCSVGGRSLSAIGTATVLSFHATKVVNGFEGGAIVTNDSALAARLRLLRNFGFADYDRVVCLGINAKMNEISAAMVLTSLEDFEHFVTVNRRQFAAYQSALAGVPGVSLLMYDEACHPNYQYVVLQIEESIFGLSRDMVQRLLWAENIRARRYFYPGCHRMEPYFSEARLPRPLPHTERLAATVLCLPTGVALPEGAASAIADTIRLAQRHAGPLRDRLEKMAAASDPALSRQP